MTFEQCSIGVLRAVRGQHTFPLCTQFRLYTYGGSFMAYHEVHVHQRHQRGHPQYCSCRQQVPSPDLSSARQSLLLPLTTTLKSSADSLISVAQTWGSCKKPCGGCMQHKLPSRTLMYITRQVTHVSTWGKLEHCQSRHTYNKANPTSTRFLAEPVNARVVQTCFLW